MSIILGLNVSLSAPSTGTQYLKGENVTFIVQVNDDQPIPVLNTTVNLTLISYQSQELECTPVVGMVGGDYHCTINTTLLQAGWHNLSVKVNKTYYNPGTLEIEKSIFVKTKPILSGANVTSEQGGTLGGWGETWQFLVNITDEDLDNVTVYLRIKKYTDPDSAWTTSYSNPINISTYTNNPDLEGPINATVYLNYTKPSTFQDNQVVWQYKFEAEDSRLYTDETEPRNFTIEKDNITIEIDFGNGETIWRPDSNSITLSVNVTDIDQDKPALSSNVTFWVTTNSSDPNSFDIGAQLFADVNGTAEYPFDPDCG